MKAIRVEQRPQHGWGATFALEPRFAPMVERLERLATRDPRSHARRVLTAGLLGYGVLGATLLLPLALCAGIIIFLVAHPGATVIGIKLLVPTGAVGLSVILALRVDWPGPEGFAVTQSEAPELYRRIDRVRDAVKGPRIHDVRITEAMNAAITQYARFLFLPSRNVLLLGLPLLQALEAREVDAVIAHEMGHFAGRHGRTAAFIYHVRTRWMQLAERLPTGIVAAGLRRFFAWYGPWFAAYSFVLARRQEYEADARAAAIVGPETMSNALVRLECQTARWHSGWSLIWSQAVERPDPPASPYRLLATTALGEEDESAANTLARALAENPDLDDTHPSLAQRLAALGETPRLPPPIVFPAADALLGSALPDIVDRLDAAWHAVAAPAWAEDYQAHVDMRAERAALEARAAEEALDENSHHRLADLIEAIDGPRSGAEAFAALLARFPDAQGARFRYGDALLDAGDEAGIEPLLQAAAAEPALHGLALGRIVRYAHAQGRADLIEAFAPRFEAAVEADEKTRRESSVIDESVELHPLDEQRRDELVAHVSEVSGIAWLRAGQRNLAAGPQIIFVFKAAPHHTANEVLDALIEAILPSGDVLGIEHSRSRRWLTSRLQQLPNNVIRA
ncbi:M48 family metalloprotease [Sphingosinicella sp. BN140058]|uniref:M48 family metalloprotease n=1 Tax=Sphingosinicella sp. BN140058 TaxID=1892855 RepID=UPI0010113C92|nr:M48 family metallopeptidase [Sphingosinicella sp. BN140058]QAY75223.1 hypothetical protein ETR14_00760 [Sphingosinicella sp. BN140058]